MYLTTGTCIRLQILQMKGNFAQYILASTCTIFANFESQNKHLWVYAAGRIKADNLFYL